MSQGKDDTQVAEWPKHQYSGISIPKTQKQLLELIRQEWVAIIWNVDIYYAIKEKKVDKLFDH